MQRWAKSLGERGYANGNYWANLVGSGLRDRSYDIGKIPGADVTGLGTLKDMKDFGEWWRGRQEAERDRKEKVFKSIDPNKDPDGKARLSFLMGLSAKEQEKQYRRMSANERAELRDMGAAGQRLDNTLSVEERDKTEKARKYVASSDTLKTVQDATTVTTPGGGVQAPSLRDATIVKAIQDMKDEHVAKIKPETMVADEVIGTIQPAKFKRWAIANEDKIDATMATYLAAGIRRTTADEQDNIYAQLVSTKGGNAGVKYIMKAMKDAGYVSP